MAQETFEDMDNETLEEFKNGVLSAYVYHVYPSLGPELVQSLAKMNQMKMSRLVLTEGELKRHADKVASKMSPLKNRNDRNNTTGYASYGEDGHLTTKCTKQYITITINTQTTPHTKEQD